MSVLRSSMHQEYAYILEGGLFEEGADRLDGPWFNYQIAPGIRRINVADSIERARTLALSLLAEGWNPMVLCADVDSPLLLSIDETDMAEPIAYKLFSEGAAGLLEDLSMPAPELLAAWQQWRQGGVDPLVLPGAVAAHLSMGEALLGWINREFADDEHPLLHIDDLSGMEVIEEALPSRCLLRARAMPLAILEWQPATGEVIGRGCLAQSATLPAPDQVASLFGQGQGLGKVVDLGARRSGAKAALRIAGDEVAWLWAEAAATDGPASHYASLEELEVSLSREAGQLRVAIQLPAAGSDSRQVRCTLLPAGDTGDPVTVDIRLNISVFDAEWLVGEASLPLQPFRELIINPVPNDEQST